MADRFGGFGGDIARSWTGSAGGKNQGAAFRVGKLAQLRFDLSLFVGDHGIGDFEGRGDPVLKQGNGCFAWGVGINPCAGAIRYVDDSDFHSIASLAMRKLKAHQKILRAARGSP